MERLSSGDRGPIALAEKVLALLDEGRFTATYKYTVLLGLIDLCGFRRIPAADSD